MASEEEKANVETTTPQRRSAYDRQMERSLAFNLEEDRRNRQFLMSGHYPNAYSPSAGGYDNQGSVYSTQSTSPDWTITTTPQLGYQVGVGNNQAYAVPMVPTSAAVTSAQMVESHPAQMVGYYPAQFVGDHSAQMVGGYPAQLVGDHSAQMVGYYPAQMAESRPDLFLEQFRYAGEQQQYQPPGLAMPAEPTTAAVAAEEVDSVRDVNNNDSNYAPTETTDGTLTPKPEKPEYSGPLVVTSKKKPFKFNPKAAEFIPRAQMPPNMTGYWPDYVVTEPGVAPIAESDMTPDAEARVRMLGPGPWNSNNWNGAGDAANAASYDVFTDGGHAYTPEIEHAGDHDYNGGNRYPVDEDSWMRSPWTRGKDKAWGRKKRFD